MISIPFPKTIQPYMSLVVTLDGAEYQLHFRWNTRAGWFIGLSDQLGDAIFSPVRMVTNFNYLRTIVDDRAPPGILWCMDNSAAGMPPDYLGLGTTHQLIYVPLDETEEFVASI